MVLAPIDDVERNAHGLHDRGAGTAEVMRCPLAALTIASPFLYIQPAYATPQRLQNEAQLPPDLTRTELRFGDAIRWIGYRVESTRVQPGDTLIVTLYWQGLRSMSVNYSTGIRLFAGANWPPPTLPTTEFWSMP